MTATIIETNPKPFNEVAVDPITIDLIERGFENGIQRMNALIFRVSMSPLMREQRDSFPILTDRDGAQMAGQFGSPVKSFIDNYDGTIEEGDIFLTNDPYVTDGAISHLNDWLVVIPVFHDGRLIGWSAIFGHQTDIGGSVPGSMPIASHDIFEEGIVIPVVKLYSRGQEQTDITRMLTANSRSPHWIRADLNALVSAARLGHNAILEMATRFGVDPLYSAIDALKERCRTAMQHVIRTLIPEERSTFEDYLCDDGMGTGPYRVRLSVWREDDTAYFDFEGTDPQSAASINLPYNPQMFRMLTGQMLVFVFDPGIVVNDGFSDLIQVKFPKGSWLNPEFPAATSGRTHGLGRISDVISGALGKSAPESMSAAGFSSSPHFVFSGQHDNGRDFLLFQVGFGGIPGRPIGDGIDCHSLWPKFRNMPNEYIEAHFPIIVDTYRSIPDSGGPGKHRGGNGLEVVYQFLAAGTISIHDDRWLTYPWGINGGSAAARSRKRLLSADGTERPLPSKCDNVVVQPGDKLVFATWGGGGWGDPFERAFEDVAADLVSGAVTADGAKRYGVVLDGNGEIDVTASQSLRAQLRSERGDAPWIDRGFTSVDELLARCESETGLPAPVLPG
ncbi:UNVERIFIED_ORG: N-methylhydantoinase B [Gordonia westfalica J30]